MGPFTDYLLKSAAWLTGFTLVYLLFLRNERYFQLKRVYLLTGIIVTLTFPFINVHYQVILPEPVSAGNLIGESSGGFTAGVQQAPVFNFNYLLAGIYLSGITILVIRIGWQLYKLLTSIRQSKVSELGNARLIKATEYGSSFSFFNYIFVNASVEDDELQEIMNHELVHITQKHWLDLVLGELLRMLQWANPFAWIYAGLIRVNHEYLADQTALQRSSDPAVYKAALLNQVFRSPVISLSNSFNYSVTKTRFDMMKKIVTSPYRKLKVLMILPVFAIIFYAFATPEYKYSEPLSERKTKGTIAGDEIPSEIIGNKPLAEPVNQNDTPATVKQQKQVQGIVVDEAGKPLKSVNVGSTGSLGRATGTSTDENGHFSIIDIDQDAVLSFMLRGYKSQSKKADFSKEMKIIMMKDPDYKEAKVDQVDPVPGDQPLILLDGEVTKETLSAIHSKYGKEQLGPTVRLLPKEAIEKYGDAGKNGAIEVYTKKKAEELGLKNTFKRTKPEDFPTFQGGAAIKFSQWVADNTQYPPEAVSKGISGRISVSYQVESDGTLSDIKSLGPAYPILTDAVIKAMNSAPKWEPAKTPDIKVPDKIRVDKSYVVAEKMPQYPGGDKALLEYINQNTKYPEDMKDLKIMGRVIVRFLVNYEGNVTEVMILKGVHPKLDAEALRVVKTLKRWEPGIQDGRPVDVWYMVPVYFTFTQAEELRRRPEGYGSPFSGETAHKLLNFICDNTKYPATARNSNTEATVYVTVKMGKGGIVRETKTATVKDGIAVPFLPWVVILGYRSDKNINPDELRLNKDVKIAATTEILENEALRVAKMLGKVEAPEWQDKDIEFAIEMKFSLK